jgi:hypothetical protein
VGVGLLYEFTYFLISAIVQPFYKFIATFISGHEFKFFVQTLFQILNLKGKGNEIVSLLEKYTALFGHFFPGCSIIHHSLL